MHSVGRQQHCAVLLWCCVHSDCAYRVPPELQPQALRVSWPRDSQGEGLLAEDGGVGLDQRLLWVGTLPQVGVEGQGTLAGWVDECRQPAPTRR